MVKVVAPVVVLFAMVAGEPSSFLASRDLQQVNSEDSGLAIECGDMSGDTTEFHLLGKACMTLDTDRQECCKQHLKNIARELPWWAWIAIAVGVVALISCLIGCLCRLCRELLCCPCRLCCPSCFGKV
mmetsp:Transcript_17212/g.30183  ORF Transcript_17212/g.30183 Transcript_17212/m.30183 type:complete len:128 (+) Transcript_17212:88-471(+)